MLRSLLTLVFLLGCSAQTHVPFPEADPCAGSLPALGDGFEREVVFPPRDFMCAEDDGFRCTRRQPLRSEEQRTVTVRNELGGVSLVYLIDRLSLPEATADPDGEGPLEAEAVGFDLDGIASGDGSVEIDATCEEFNQDFGSPYETVMAGVDNAFQGLVGTVEGALDASRCPGMNTDGCLDAMLDEDIRSGELLLLLELSDLDSLEHDENVSVALYVGRTVDGGPPALAADGSLLPGQRFETVATLVEPTEGDILHRRLRVRWPGVDLPRERFGYPSQLTEVELRASLCADGLTRGHMGGLSSVDDLAAQIVEGFGPGFEETTRSILESIADIRPTSDPYVCEFVSTVYALEGVPAERVR